MRTGIVARRSRAWWLGVVVVAAPSWALPGCGSSGEDDTGFTHVSGPTTQDGGDAAVHPDAKLDAVAEPLPAADAEPEAEAPAKLGPPYPIVFAHGFFGFQDFAGIGFITYFYGVKDYLVAHGEPNVFTPAVDPFNTSEFRGAELTKHVQEILAQTGYAKVNLIGHSQGGLDARVVAHDHPDLIDSVVTVATPHTGTPVADVVLKLAPNPQFQQILDELVNLVGGPIWDQIGNQTSISASLKALSSTGAATFNAKYPDAPGIPYFSVAGRSNLSLGLTQCLGPGRPKFVTDWDATLDPINPLLGVTGALLVANGDVNDGLVGADSAKWGKFLGCVPADHLDEIGQLFGASPGLGNGWDYKAFYLELVKYLRSQGH